VKPDENIPGFSATTADGKEMTVGPVGTALLWLLLIVRPSLTSLSPLTARATACAPPHRSTCSHWLVDHSTLVFTTAALEKSIDFVVEARHGASVGVVRVK
jgi:hypothetical protein